MYVCVCVCNYTQVHQKCIHQKGQVMVWIVNLKEGRVQQWRQEKSLMH